MSPDRLAELRRQRALVAQHLAWIDAELTAAGAGQAPGSSAALSSSGASGTAPKPAGAAATSLDGPASTGAAAFAGDGTAAPVGLSEDDPALALANARADEIIEKYRATEALDPNQAERGCIVLFVSVFVLGAATLLAIYYFGYAGR